MGYINAVEDHLQGAIPGRTLKGFPAILAVAGHGKAALGDHSLGLGKGCSIEKPRIRNQDDGSWG